MYISSYRSRTPAFWLVLQAAVPLAFYPIPADGLLLLCHSRLPDSLPVFQNCQGLIRSYHGLCTIYASRIFLHSKLQDIPAPCHSKEGLSHIPFHLEQFFSKHFFVKKHTVHIHLLHG